MVILGDILKRSKNNFDLIRLIAALMVVFGHSFVLFKNNGSYDPIQNIFHESSGTLAVYIFFFLSGIFISASFLNKKDHISFVRMRFFRIWPGLIICTIFTVLVIGILFTDLTFKQFFFNTDTWTYLISNISFYNSTSHRLPGLFVNNPYGSAVNGSLWTLPFEVKCYCLVFLFGVTGLLNKRIPMALFFLVLVYLLIFHSSYIDFFGGKLLLFFVAGMVAYLFNDILILDYRIALPAILICAFIYRTDFFTLGFYITLIYSTIVLSASRIFRKIKLPGDYSYGIYIYGFLIQQTLIHLFPDLSPYPGFFISLPIVFILSALSWHLIEKPAINYAKSPQVS